MDVKVLGCSGGIGDAKLQTTSILINEDTLIDAGTGLVFLNLEQMAKIKQVFLTHSHMDHIASFPLLIDSTAELRTQPLVIYALEETIESIRKHIFNWQIWPDFSEIVINNNKSVQFISLKLGDKIDLRDNEKIIVGPAEHQVKACSYLLVGNRKKLFFSGDTYYDQKIIDFIQENQSIENIILECSFPKKERELALAAKHMDARNVSDMIKELDSNSKYYITHLKPSQRKIIMNEILQDKIIKKKYNVSQLNTFQEFNL